MKWILFLLITFNISSSIAQTPGNACNVPEHFIKTYPMLSEETRFRHMAVNSKDDIYLAGNSAYRGIALIVKTNHNGDTLWNRSLPGISTDDALKGILATKDDGFLAFGYAWEGIIVIKGNADGSIAWAEEVHDDRSGQRMVRGAVEMADGSFILTGATTTNLPYSVDATLWKLSSTGNIIWTKILEMGTLSYGQGIAALGNDIIISGYTSDKTVMYKGDGFASRIDASNGDIKWINSYSAGDLMDLFFDISSGAPGEFIISTNWQFGYVANPVLQQTGGYLKINDQGAVLGETVFKTQIGEGRTGAFIGKADGSIMGIFQFNGPFSGAVFEMDKYGTFRWVKKMNIIQPESISDAAVNQNGELLVCGNRYSGAGQAAFLAKLDADGNAGACKLDPVVPVKELLVIDMIPSPFVSASSLNNARVIPVDTKLTVLNIFPGNVCSAPDCKLLSMADSDSCATTYQKYFGGDGDDIGLDIITLADRGNLVCGKTSSGSAGLYDGFIARLTPDGSILWSKTIGNSEDDEIRRVKRLADGSFIGIGTTTEGGLQQMMLVKLDANGNLIWNRTYKPVAGKSAAGKNVLETSDQKIILAATLNDSLPGSDGLVMALDKDGNELWNTVFDQGHNEGLNGIVELNGNIYAGGYVVAETPQACILKIDAATGGILWGKTYGEYTGSYFNTCEDLVTSGGNLYFMTIDYDGSQWGKNAVKIHFILLDPDGVVTDQNSMLPIQSNFYATDFITGAGFAVNSAGSIFIANTTGNNIYSRGGYAKMTNTRFQEFVYLSEFTGIYTFSGVSPLSNGGLAIVGKQSYYGLKGLKNYVLIRRTDELGRTGNCMLQGSHITPGGFDYYGPASKEVIERGQLTIPLKHEGITGETFTGTIAESGFNEFTSCSEIRCQPPVRTWSSCSNSYNVSYSTGRPSRGFSYAPASDGTGAFVGYSVFKTEGITWTNIAENGSIINTNFWGNDTISRKHSFNCVLPDESYISAGYAYVGQSSNTNFPPAVELTRWAKNGMPVKDRIFTIAPMEYITAMHYGADGFIYIAGSYQANHGPKYIMKFDTDLNLIWCKKIESGSDIIRSLLYKDGMLFAAHAGESVDPYANEATVQILRLDAATGNYQWNKTCSFPGKSFIAGSLFSSGAGIALTGGIGQGESFYTIVTPGLIRLNMDGSFKDGVRFKDLGVFQDFSSYLNYQTVFTQAADNKFVFGAASGRANNNIGIVAFKFDTLGVAEWGWNYPATSKYQVQSISCLGNHVYLAGQRSVAAYNNYMEDMQPFLLKLKSDGLAKDETAMGFCEAVKYLPEAVAFVGRIDSYEDHFTAIDAPPYRTLDVALEERPWTMREIPECVEQAVCQLTTVDGPDKVCNLKDVVVFTITKHPDCKAPVTWKVDENMAKIISYTDVSVTVSFVAAGDCAIEASILDGCTIKRAQKIVKISDQSKPVDLGSTKEICKDASVVLHAGSGFAEYLWQDQATTTEDFKATLPGTYTVEVTDYCGKTGSASVEVKTAPPVVVNLGNDTALCRLDSITLKAPAGMLSYQWDIPVEFKTVNDSTVRMPVTQKSKIGVLIERSQGCTGSDEMTVDVIEPPLIALGPDIKVCEHDPVTIAPSTDPAMLDWNTGSKAHILTVTSPGEYIATGSNESGCKSADTINVSFMNVPKFTLGKDTALCEQTSYNLYPSDKTFNYVWQDGSTQKGLKVKDAGLYWAQTVGSNGCIFRDSLIITHINTNPSHFLNDHMEICIGRKYELKPERIFDQYLWSNGSKESVITIKDSGNVVLNVTDAAGCRGADTIHVSGERCLTGIFVPNTFTPNNDGSNDVMKPIIYEVISRYKFTIMNRWGQKVFETNDPDTGWNGSFKGLVQPSGSFVYMIQYNNEDNKTVFLKGSILLVR